MKIRGRKPALGCSASLSSPSPSSSATSSDSSSITAAASSASFQDSSNSSPHPSPHRWHGLDLLVKAIHQVTAGSVIGVPYIQRRVTIRRRRRRGLDSAPFVFEELPERKSSKRVCNSKEKKNKMMKKKGFTVEVKDSVLHSWVARSELVGGQIGL
ncbi:hypothetical protein AAHA92_31656 [Salvia divinorum]